MSHINFEFKARTIQLEILEKKLLEFNPEFIGSDHQTDTYFNVNHGRLKLREGNIENSLIYYERNNVAGAKQSDIILYNHTPQQPLKDLLIKVHGVKVIVNKIRKIYFVENVKFHFDTVEGLGKFIEVEAIDSKGKFSVNELKKKCEKFANFFDIQPQDYVSESYSDLLMQSKKDLE